MQVLAGWPHDVSQARLLLKGASAAGGGSSKAVVHPCAVAHKVADCRHELPDMRSCCLFLAAWLMLAALKKC